MGNGRGVRHDVDHDHDHIGRLALLIHAYTSHAGAGYWSARGAAVWLRLLRRRHSGS
jgi:hypothetical protein